MPKITPSKAVKLFCTECVGSRKRVPTCRGNTAVFPCPLFPYRMGKRAKLKLLRDFCVYCMGGAHKLVRNCKSINCPFYGYRMGHRPVEEFKRTK